jgi:hypothetical protein
MFDPDKTRLVDATTLPTARKVDPERQLPADSGVIERHAVLMDCLRDEGDLQAEERLQMAIDSDYDDHLQWRPEDAQVLMDRGQAPLVFNEGRQTREWITGMQKRQRTDYKILPRERGDVQSAEAKTKVFKYVSDANLAQWHESRAFKQAVISGLGWLEEGISTDPGVEQIYAGSEDWRNVFRDSRCLDFDLKSARYLFRKKRTDLDYAMALLPYAKEHLRQQASEDLAGSQRQEDIWYLGERLTGSTEMAGVNSLPGRYRDRSAYIGGPDARDRGRRLSVDLMEAWYRVPEAVKVFASGPLKGKTFDEADEGHQQLANDRWRLYSAVTMRMRVMIATEAAPMWDGKSPFKHNNFLLVPVWGYRRGNDGQCYGIWRGMRDLNDDINKRASKALHAASSNRVVAKKNAVPDLERARQEAARPDMFLEVKELNDIRFEKPTADMQMNMQMLSFNREIMRNIGGVTQANLGQNSNAVSGVAIGKQQDQGSIVTSEFPDNLRLAKQMAGRLRLSHIEQFMTEKQVIRILGENSPVQWLTVNDVQEDGTVLNDISGREADFIIGEQNYRESFAQAAMESMMELLGQIAGYAPQVVMNVLDLVVDSAEITNKEEWVSRIRQLNGQRDPTKEPTPEEQAAQEDGKKKQAAAEQMQMEQLQLGMEKLRAEVAKLDTEAMLKRVESMFSALQAAQIVAMNPTVAPVADTIAKGAGFKDQDGEDPNLPAAGAQPQPPQPPQPGTPGIAQPPDLTLNGSDPAAGVPVQPREAMPDAPSSLEGVQQGIETTTPADNGPAM